MGVAKVSKPLGEAHTKDYPREQQNAYYYTEGAHAPGLWHGKLAEKWGLVGPIDMAQYDLLAAGKHPHTEEQLIKHRLPPPDPRLWEPKWLTDHVAWEEHVRNLWALGERAQLPGDVREFMDEMDPLQLDPVEFRVVPPGKPEKEAKTPALHVASWDVVVSPHKSYSASALVGGDKRIVDWHNRAVTEMLDAGELYAQTRMGKARLPYTTGNWAVARFVHDTSRPVENRAPDPQLHTHCVIMNMTDADGKVRALLTWEIFAIQSYMNAVYEASLARQARAGGYELEHGKNFSTRIKGYSDEYLESISARTNEIEAEKERRGVTGAAADEIINKALRQPKQEWDPEALKAEHRRQAEEFGQHPERIVAESKAREVHMLSPAEIGKLAHRSIDHARDRLFEHQAVNDHYELMRDALRAGLGHLRLQDVEEAFAGRQEFVRVGHYRENAPGARYTTKAMQQMERQSIQVMLAGRGSTPPISPDLTRDQFRELYKARDVDGKQIELNDSQMWMAYRVLTEPHQFMIIRGAAGTGKCLKPGTSVLLFCGCVRSVEEIQIGDLLMGPDSYPRSVVSTTQGEGEMYEVTPVKGVPYVVNAEHVLSLQMTGRMRKSNGKKIVRYHKGQVINLSVAEYLQRGINFKHDAKGWRTGVEFSAKSITIDPYFLGVWLGDGTSENTSITTPEPEIALYISGYAERLGLQVTIRPETGCSNHAITKGHNGLGMTISERKNWLLDELRRLGLNAEKRVPIQYKANTRAIRLEVLAGLIDTDGSLDDCGNYDFVAKGEGLADDVVFIARSLGLAAYKKPTRKTCHNNGISGDYFRVCISGHISEIPVKVQRKKAQPRKQKKSVLRTGITVKSAGHGHGKYCGFELDGDGLFVMGDFTVTHNSTALEPIAEIAGEVGRWFHKKAGYQVIGMASTSGATNNLKELGIESMTLQAHNLAPVDPNAQKRLYIVDEGSLIGTQQFYRFLKSVRPEDRVIIAYDPRQHQAVEAGRIVEEMEMAGVRTVTLEKIVRQRNNPALLEVVNDWKEGRITEGLKKLNEQAHLWQVPDRKKRFQAMAQWYAEHDDTLMVAPDNRSIAELNAAARVEMRKVEKLGADRYEATILVGTRDVREADRKLAVMYEAGNVIRWGKGVAMLGVKSGDYTPVVRTDTAKNLVTIDVYGTEKTYNPRLAYGVEIYNAERRKLAVGERIQITRPWRLNKNERIPNRAMATIKALDAKGRGELEFEDGRKVRWDVRAMPHADYAYALTSYSLQYATAENVLLHIDTGDSRIRSLVDKSLVYVGGSRAAQTLHVFTDDRSVLLGESSPANRQALKPKALAEEEIRGYAVGVAS